VAILEKAVERLWVCGRHVFLAQRRMHRHLSSGDGTVVGEMEVYRDVYAGMELSI
jgi:hypothetical protein